jgi:acyl transferase domain-containing protein
VPGLVTASTPAVELPAGGPHRAACLWATGADVDWTAFLGSERRRRVPMPTYPFQRTRCWIDPPGR